MKQHAGTIRWILIIGGIVLVAFAAVAATFNGFSAPSWVLPWGTLAALVGLAIP